MASVNKFTFYAPTSITSLVLSGATMTDGTVLIEDNTFTGSYGGTSTSATTISSRMGFSDTTISTAFSQSTNYAVLNNVTVDGITGNCVWNFTGGYGFIYGGAFTNNSRTGGNGGVIYANSSNNAFIIRVKGALFADNSADKGGAVYANTKSHVFYGATFSGNEATAHGGALFLVEGATIVDTDFTGNSAATGGGAIYAKGGDLAISGGTFGGNTSGQGGAIDQATGSLTVSAADFAENTADKGGALYLLGEASIRNSTFRDNRAADRGGAVMAASAAYETTIADSTFSGNRATFGAAILVDSGASARISDTVFDGNVATSSYNGVLFAHTDSSVTLTGDVQFRESTDTIFLNSGATLAVTDAAITLNASLTSSGATVNVTGSEFLFGNTAAIDVAGLTFTGNNALTFRGTAAVNFASQDISGAAIAVDAGILPSEGGSVTIATGISAMGPTVTVGDQSVTLGVETVIGGGTYTFALADGNFTVTSPSSFYSTVAVAPAGTESVVVCGTTYALEHRYDTLAAAAAHLEDGGTLILAGQSFTAADKVMSNAATVLIADAVTGDSGNLSIYGNTCAYYDGDVTMKLDRFALTADRVIPVNGGTVNGNWTVEIDNSSSVSDENVHGYFIFASGRVAGDVVGTIRNSDVASVLCLNSRTVVAGELHFTLSDSTVANDIIMTGTGQADTVCTGVNYTITDSCVGGNVYGSGYSSNPTIGGDIDIRLTGSTVMGSLIGDRAHRIAADKTISVTLAGSTVGGEVAKFDYGQDHQYVLAGMTVNVTGATASVVGGLSDVDRLVIDAGASVVFTAAQDLSGVALTVDATGFTGETLTVATGVSAIGDCTITGGGDSLALLMRLNDLVLASVSNKIDAGVYEGSFTGGTLNVVTGGTVTGAFFGTNAASGKVESFISGGTVGNAVIGGAKVAKGNTAALDNVTLNIAGGELAGGPDNGGQLYTAGYAYGASESALDANVTLCVAKSELNLTGGTIAAQNLFAGAHARKGAYTVVDETVITVTDGTYKRIYGGGWAEKTARSEVGTANITVSGGKLEYIYAGGANAAGGTTVTGSATISVSGNASVDFIFLAGKNANCSVTNGAAATLSGDAKRLIRISGRNGNGADNTEGVTSLTVATNTTVDYLDYVDKLNLTQGTTLDIVELAQYEHGSDATLNFLTDGGSEAWTALSGAGFELFQSAQFQVNGEAVLRNAETGALGSSGYKLDFTDDKFIISKLA